MSTVMTPPLVGEKRFVVEGVRWELYKTFCDELVDQNVRLTYSDGRLELMVTKRPHEVFKTLIAKLLEILFYELNVPVASGGSMTFQRDDLQKGLEPDECWWIAHEAQIRNLDELDFTRDPPPDLAVEVEITSPLVNRVSIYAALQVPEIWRFDGEQLRFCSLQENGTYADVTHSRSFPFLRPEDLLPFLRIDDPRDETTRVREFGKWIRTCGTKPNP